MSEPTTMPALVWLGPRKMELCEEPVPEPTAGELILAVSAVGICGSELSGYLGQNSLRHPPLIMGHEAAGHIVEIVEPAALADGSPASLQGRVTFNPLSVCGTCEFCLAGLTNLCPKRQLIGAHRPGAFASYVRVPATQCWPVPETLTDVTASLTEPLACAVRAVHQAQVQAGQSLLILGAGPIGLFCLAVARTLGVEEILVSDLSSYRLEIARRWGATAVLDARKDDVVATIRQSFAHGVTATIDAVGATATRTQALQAVRPGGRVVCIGLHEEESPLAINFLVRQELTVIGSFGYRQSDFAHALTLLSQRILHPQPDWLEERPLASGPAAFAELVSGTARATKIVLRPASHE